ncbi:MAG: aminotransferase class I/II-fold pyridoxal phosphate-dependent enzyme [Leptospiraceae bacterium]|nr:aminotransferase class I/II-fold pyridoxal phosphate-dependent enzyme [Leptospiraceae bacterium]MCP5512884.1 aminotransferase class I/II-fold pyridoxal phosphate-dependent enzyme [Leptospiraceae bacterium]
MNEHENFETLAIRIQTERGKEREHSTPIFATSSFVFESAEQARALFADEEPGNIYTRFSNPNSSEFVEKICRMEDMEDGISTASGMSAVFSTLAGLLKSGDHILVSRSVFGSTHQILTQIFPKWNIDFTYVDIQKPEKWASAIKRTTKMIFVETPSNPALDIIDLEWLGKLSEKHKLILAVDNCFSTPYIQNPGKYGAHLSIHSATKYLDGQGRTIGGVVVGKKELIKDIRFFARHTGPALSPFNAWVLSKSLETLAIRMEKHSENAYKLATYLENHSEVESVKYPFLPSHPQYEIARKQMKLGGGIVSFQVKGGIERGRDFLNGLEMLSHSANLGDTRSIATHPASTTHSKLSDEERKLVGIEPGLIRISVGLEHIDDIIKDIDSSLNKSKK